MIKKIIIVLVLLLVVANSTTRDNVEREIGYVSETAGFYKPNGIATYHILPQKCHIIERNNNWAYIQLQDGTSVYVPSEVLK